MSIATRCLVPVVVLGLLVGQLSAEGPCYEDSCRAAAYCDFGDAGGPGAEFSSRYDVLLLRPSSNEYVNGITLTTGAEHANDFNPKHMVGGEAGFQYKLARSKTVLNADVLFLPNQGFSQTEANAVGGDRTMALTNNLYSVQLSVGRVFEERAQWYTRTSVGLKFASLRQDINETFSTGVGGILPSRATKFNGIGPVAEVESRYFFYGDYFVAGRVLGGVLVGESQLTVTDNAPGNTVPVLVADFSTRVSPMADLQAAFGTRKQIGRTEIFLQGGYRAIVYANLPQSGNPSSTFFGGGSTGFAEVRAPLLSFAGPFVSVHVDY